MKKLVHHPSGHFIINEEVVEYSELIAKFPDYKLPEGVIGREYVKGSHHFLYTGSSQLPGEFPWKAGDQYLKAFKKKEPKLVTVREAKGNAKLIEMGVYGNIWVRKQHYPEKEVVHDGHYHNHNHVSLVSSGKVLVEVEGEENTIFTAPTFFCVDANKKHKITALEDNTTVFCVYGLVDKEGKATNFYNGDNSPYGAKEK